VIPRREEEGKGGRGGSKKGRLWMKGKDGLVHKTTTRRGHVCKPCLS
jgi:hypothetical protein